MAPSIIIVPGDNLVLQRLGQQLAANADVVVLPSANALLWRARQEPPAWAVVDGALPDMTGAEIVELLPNFAPATRLVVCSPRTPELERAAQSATVQFVPPGDPNQTLWAVYQALGIAPPTGMRPATHEVAPATRGVAVSSASAPRPAAPAERPAQPAPKPVPTLLPARPAPTTLAPRKLAPEPTPIPPVPAPKRPAPATTQPATSRTPSASSAFAGANTALVTSPQQFAALNTTLTALLADVGAQCVLLSDTAGMVLLEVGDAGQMVPQLFLPLLASSFSTASELSRFLRDDDTNDLFFHEGTRYDIYAFNVGARCILTLIFDKNKGASKLGSVWVYAKRVTRQLQQALEP